MLPERAAVRILIRIVQVIVWLAVATWLGRKLLGWLVGGSAREAVPRGTYSSGPRLLRRDPVCGTHVAENISQALTIEGVTHYFCSPQCQEKFRQSHAGQPGREHSGRRAASA